MNPQSRPRAPLSTLVLLGWVLFHPWSGLNSAQMAGTPLETNVEAPAEVKIATGDLVQVSVFGAPDFDREARVNADGDIALPLLGSVHVDGLTIQEAQALIETQLREGGYFHGPQVTVLQKESTAQTVTVLGEVQKPGIYPLNGARTLYDVISTAGGTTASAGKAVTITGRNRVQGRQTIEFSYEPKATAKANVAIFPGDSIMVSKAGIVYVVGDVRQPSGIVMNNSQMTILQAIALARGPNKTAALSSAKLIRRSAKEPQQIPISLTDIMAAKAPDLKLQPNDIVFVPFSMEKAAYQRGLEAILQTVTRVGIYRY